MFIAYLIVLRLIHVVASLCWAGGSIITFLFLEPTAKKLAPMGMDFIEHMVTKGRFSIFMVVNSSLTVLSGALLFWQDASGQWLEWMRTGPGLGFTLGSLAGVVVYFIGLFGVNPRAIKLSKLGAEIKVAGGPPTTAQGAMLQKLSKEMSAFGLADFVLVVVSLALMGTARYWLF